MTRLKVTIALLSLILVAVFSIWASQRRTSPGPLHPSHRWVAELQGQDGCAACHGEKDQTMLAACGTCHQNVAAQIDKRTGLHGALDAAAAAKCADCHREHTDGAVAMINDLSFSKAGVDDANRYSHGHVRDYQLAGRHAAIACASCHPQADAAVLVKGQSRYLGLSQRCVSCHKDPHENAYGEDCASCHGQEQPFDKVAAFKHVETFPMTGSHANVACLTCHPAGGNYAVKAPRPTGQAQRQCVDCHASPHGASFIARLAESEGKTQTATCILCHDAQDSSFLHPVARMTPAQHAATGFALTPPHDQSKCVDCHAGIADAQPAATRPDDGKTFVARFPGRSADECKVCHKDPHRGQFDGGETHGRCLSCHDPLRFKPSSFDIARHERTAFPLTGAHLPAGCVDCHVEKDGVRVFAGVAKQCVTCHKDPHAGQFARQGTAIACTECHDTTRFVPSLFDVPRHVGTKFPLTGAHVKTDCAKCHREVEGVRVFTRTPAECVACHPDPHAGQFVREGKVSDCTACHALDRFTPARFDKAMHAKTQFPLTGSHEAVACRACHAEKDGVRRFASTTSRCVDCHQDIHKGLFDKTDKPAVVNGRSGCARCHGDLSFADVKWTAAEHQLWAGYELRGAHESASCAACHRRDGAARGSRYTTMPSACAGCHADPHAGQFLVEGKNDCARCHAETRRWAETHFNHQKHSAFVLDESHAQVGCAACHRESRTEEGVSVIRYRPLGARCQDCHDARTLGNAQTK